MKKRHSALVTALTLVLGIAMLTTILAVPRLRPVQNTEAAAEATQVQTFPAAAGKSPASAVQWQALQSPAYITMAAPPNPADGTWDYVPPGDTTGSPYPYRVWEHGKNGLNVPQPTGYSATTNDWRVLSPKLDILSSYTGSAAHSGHHPAVPDVSLPDMDILIPGCAGQYKFTLQNVDATEAIEYLINIEEAAKQSFPLRFNLTRDDTSQSLTGGWKYMSEIESVWLPGETTPGELTPSTTRTFTLGWEWAYERGNKVGVIAEGDGEDTDIGKYEIDDVPEYQVILNLLVRMKQVTIWVYYDPRGGTVTPDKIEYRVGDKYGKYRQPVPVRPGYRFLGWVDENGNLVNPNDLVPQGGATLYAKWEAIKTDPGGWKFFPLPIPLPVPIPLALPCLKCLRPYDICVCAKDGKKAVPPPKTGDSTAVAIGALAMLAITGGIAVFLCRKRREDDAQAQARAHRLAR